MSHNEEEISMQKFIEMYKNMPELWDFKHPKYKNKNTRNRCYEKLLIEYRKTKNDSTMFDLKRKIMGMRNCYRRELKKHRQSLTYGDDNIYNPSIWYFENFDFLRDLEPPVRSRNSMSFVRDFKKPFPSRSNYSSDDVNESENSPIIVKRNKPKKLCKSENRTHISFLHDSDPLVRSPDNISFVSDFKMPFPSRSYFSSDEVGERESSPNIVNLQNNPKKLYKNENRTEFLRRTTQNIEFSKNKEVKDEASIYSDGWACMLRQMTADQQLFAKQAVDDIMLLGRINKLSLNFLRNIDCSPVFISQNLPQTSASYCSSAGSQHFDYEHMDSPTVCYNNIGDSKI